MNVFIMLDELTTVVSDVVKNMQMDTEKGEVRAPQVLQGYLPSPDPKERNPNRAENYPFVLVRYLADESSEEGTSVDVKLVCGAFSKDEQSGWKELVLLMDIIRTRFLENPYFGKCYEVELPLKREIPEEQDVPQWVGEILLNVTVPHIVEGAMLYGDKDFFK